MERSDVGGRVMLAGAWLAALAVLAGAFGAHGLEGSVSATRLATFETAAQYHLMHAVALLLTGLLARSARRWGRGLRLAAGLFALGLVCFAGSLYALVLLDQPALGMITPLGGLAFVAGWIALGLAAARRSAR